MLAVAQALRRWRETEAAVQAGPVPLTVRVQTDDDAQTPAALKSVLDVRMAPSETNACVPFTMTERVRAQDISLLGPAVQRLLSLSGRSYLLDPDAQVLVCRMTATRWESNAGLANTAVIEWAGLASWFPARSAS